MRFSRILLFCVLATALVCRAETRSVSVVEATVQTSPTWTLMIYLDGDNNLEPFALIDMQEMLGGVDSQKVKLLVMIDRSDGYDSTWDDWKGTRIYQAVSNVGGVAAWQLVSDLGEQNMGDPAVLERFVASSIRANPAERYGLIMWDHGGGWSNHANDEKIPGSDGADFLTLVELRGAIERALVESNVQKLALLGFDMCLMAQLETMAEMDEVAEIMVASQAVEPGDGWPYQSVLRLFGEYADAAPVASGIVEVFDDYYRRRGEPVHTLAAFDLSETTRLVQALGNLVNLPIVQQRWQDLIKSIYFSESYNDLTDYRRGVHSLQSWDLMSIMHNLTALAPALVDMREWHDFEQAFDSSVISSRVSRHHANSHGIAIYAPYRADLANAAWRNTELGGAATGWSKLLQTVLDAQKNSQASVKIEDIQTFSASRGEVVPDVIQFGQDGFLYRLRGENALRSLAWRGSAGRAGKTALVSKTVFSFHQEDQYERASARDRLAAVRGYSLPDGDSEIFDRFDGSYLIVTDGKNVVRATIDQSDIGAKEQGYFLTRVLYDHPVDGRYEGTLRFNWLWEADHLSLAVPQGGGEFSYMSITPKPDARLHFVLETLDARGNLREEFGGSLVWGSGLSLTLDLLEPGDYVNLFGVEDLAGNMTFKRHDFRLNKRSDQFVEALELRNLTVENLAGEWEVLDAGPWFDRQKLVPLQGRVVYEPLAGYSGVLGKTIYKDGKVISPEGLVTVIATTGIAHTRDYVLVGDEPDQGWGVRSGLPVFDEYRKTTLLLGMDLNDGSVGVMRKVAGAKPVLAPVTDRVQAGAPNTMPSQNAAQHATALEGSWTSSQGMTLVFEGSEWGMFSFGNQSDGGSFFIDGSLVAMESQLNGAVTQYEFQKLGRLLYMRDAFGNLFEFYKSN